MKVELQEFAAVLGVEVVFQEQQCAASQERDGTVQVEVDDLDEDDVYHLQSKIAH